MQDIEEQLKKIINDYSALIHQVILRNLFKFEICEIEDIEQEVKIKIWNFLKKGKKIEKIMPYIRKVAYTVTIDELRKLRNRNHSPPKKSYDLEILYNVIFPYLIEIENESPDLLYERQQLKLLLNELINSLGIKRRRVLGLYAFGFSIKEIGDLLKWDNTKVRHLLYRGIEELRQKIREKKIFSVQNVYPESERKTRKEI